MKKKNKEISFLNESGLDFSDISSEKYRAYTWLGDDGYAVQLKIKNPLLLNVSPSGGHRIFDRKGLSHYIPKGWLEIVWKSKKK